MSKSVAVGIAVASLSLVAAPAFANPFLVPEIDATAGTAAMASLAATVALVWERRRRRK